MSSTDDRHGDEQTDTRLAAEYANNHPPKVEHLPDGRVRLTADPSLRVGCPTGCGWEGSLAAFHNHRGRCAVRAVLPNHPKPDTTEEK